MLSVLCKNELAVTLKDILFTHTSTIGLREYLVSKNFLRRTEQMVTTKYGNVRVKQSYYQGQVVQSKPEYDDINQLATEHHVSLQTIVNEVHKQL